MLSKTLQIRRRQCYLDYTVFRRSVGSSVARGPATVSVSARGLHSAVHQRKCQL